MTTQNDDSKKPRQDWNNLAKQALDLWQHHLTSLSQDEKAKADMAEMVRPMTQMATQWAEMMQTYAQPTSSSTEPSQQESATDSTPEEAAIKTKKESVTQPESEAPKETVVEKEFEQKISEIKETMQAPAFKVEVAKVDVEDTTQNDIQSDEPAELLQSEQPAASTVMDQPKSDVTVPAQPVVEPEQSPSRSTTSTSGSGDLANIADRLAQLEQELDSLRPRSKRSIEDSRKTATDS